MQLLGSEMVVEMDWEESCWVMELDQSSHLSLAEKLVGLVEEMAVAVVVEALIGVSELVGQEMGMTSW